jgi:precorrin-4 methylase
VTLVDVIAQGIGVAELLVTRCTRVVMEADVLAHAGCALELCIAVGA